MGFKSAKNKIITCLKSGMVYHQQRNNLDTKNVLAMGVITNEHVAQIIARSSGDGYSSSPHHMDSNIDVHIVKTRYAGFQWYIKWYFMQDDGVFISVHNRSVSCKS